MVNTKICTKCEIEKVLTQFYKRNASKDGCSYNCRECVKKTHKGYRDNNKDALKKRNKNYRDNNSTDIAKYQKTYRIDNKKKLINYHKIYQQENKEKRNEHAKERRLNDPIFKLTCDIRASIYSSFKNHKKNVTTIDILGCSFEEFKLHLESQFEDWMTWDNKGNPKDGILELNKTWDCDHIIPISSAKTVEDVIMLNHYTNFQPLCSHINRHIKGNNLDYIKT